MYTTPTLLLQRHGAAAVCRRGGFVLRNTTTIE
jgi:hypothetical protein